MEILQSLLYGQSGEFQGQVLDLFYRKVGLSHRELLECSEGTDLVSNRSEA